MRKNKIINKLQLAISNVPCAIGNKQSTIVNKQSATSKWRSAISDKQYAIGKLQFIQQRFKFLVILADCQLPVLKDCQLPIANCRLPIVNFKRLPFAICLLLIANCQFSNAQSLSLKEALEFATKNNLSIQSSELESKMYSELKGSAFDLPKTEFTGQFGQINTNAQDKNFSVSQSFSPFQYGAKKKLLAENSNLSQLKMGVTKQEIAFNIRQSWNALLYYSELNKMLQKQNNLMQKFVRSASLRFQTGETNALEKTTAEAKQQELEQKIKHNDAMIWVEKSKIKTFLNRQENFVSTDTSFVALPTLGILDSTLVKENPNVKLASQQVNVAEANRKVEKATLLPDISAGYFIQSLTGNQEVNGQTVYYDGTPRFQGFSVGISLPIFAGSNVSKIQASKTNIEMQQKNADYLKLELSNHYQQQIQQLNTFQSLVDYYKTTALANADLITKNAGKAYQNGDVSYVEYVQALETALTIRTNYINAINNFNQTVINLQFLVNQ